MDPDLGDDDGKLTARQKGVLGFVWTVAGVYSLMSEQILSKGIPPPCSVVEDLDNNLNVASVVIALIIPIVVGPVLVIVLHVAISIVTIVTGCETSSNKNEVPTIYFLFSLTLVFVITYSINMILTEAGRSC